MNAVSLLMSCLESENHAALITSDCNRRYFTGLSSSAGVAVVTSQKAYFIIDSRYFEKAQKTIQDFEVILQDDLRKQILEILLHHNIKKLSIESKYMTVNELHEYHKKYHHNLKLDISDWLSEKIEEFRICKDENEVDCIKKAQEIAEKAFEKILDFIRVGRTEKEIAAELNYYMMKFGADGISFDTIAISGQNTSMPHGTPSNKKVQNGEFITMDFGAVYNAYHSDMTRTIAVGKPTTRMQEVYMSVTVALQDAIEAAKPNITCNLLDSVARNTLEAWGLDKYFGHGLGHGVGIEIHEAPSVSPKCGKNLQKGMVITIEPGVYIPKKFGVRVEDMVLITDDGCENLTKSTKKLIYL